jgi:hypothetical protein
MPQDHCPNCGVLISEAPEADGLHPAQMATGTEAGETYCEACVFGGSGAPKSEGQYEATGDDIVRAAGVGAGDEELAEMLAGSMTAEGLRGWMGAHGMERARGSDKLESARQAVRQNRAKVAGSLDRARSISTAGEHSALCECGFEEHFMDEEAAAGAAERHAAENPGHSPKAWAEDGRRLYG